LAVARDLLAHADSGDHNLLQWNLAVAGDPSALAALAAAMDSPDRETRRSAAYALRWLRPKAPAVLQALACAANREPRDSPAYAYLVGAALSLRPESPDAPVWRAGLERVIATGS